MGARTGQKWLQQRREQGGPPSAARRKGKTCTGRPLKVPDEVLDQLLSYENSVRDQNYEQQMDHFGFHCHPRTLQHSLTTRRNVMHFQKTKAKKVRDQNKEMRVEYGHKQRTGQLRISGALYTSQMKRI